MKVASLSVVERATVGWSDQVLFCRAYGHEWHPRTATRHGNAYTVGHHCNRCGTSRSQDLNQYGIPTTSWRTTYPDGYLLIGEGRLDQQGRGFLRIASLRHAHVTEQEVT